MGLILDSSVAIPAERRGDTVAAMLRQIVVSTGYRAQTAEVRNRRDAFIRELLNDVDVYPYTVSNEYPTSSAVAPINRSANGMVTPRFCCSPSSLPPSKAASFVPCTSSVRPTADKIARWSCAVADRGIRPHGSNHRLQHPDRRREAKFSN